MKKKYLFLFKHHVFIRSRVDLPRARSCGSSHSHEVLHAQPGHTWSLSCHWICRKIDWKCANYDVPDPSLLDSFGLTLVKKKPLLLLASLEKFCGFHVKSPKEKVLKQAEAISLRPNPLLCGFLIQLNHPLRLSSKKGCFNWV